MKIHLKILVCYLPYGLKMSSHGRMYTLDGFILESALNVQDKPILRPLSDLTKEIEHNGEKFVPIDILEWNSYEHIIKSGKCTSVSYSYMIQLFEWHFDVFGLIPQGLAIDINTLEMQP